MNRSKSSVAFQYSTMKCSLWLKQNPNRCVNLASWIFFLVCLSVLSTFSYQCLHKFLDYPQGVDISTHYQNAFEFPALTFCPYTVTKSGNPPAWNISNIEKCGLEFDDIFYRKIVIGSKGYCTDPR